MGTTRLIPITFEEAGQQDRDFWRQMTPVQRVRHLESLREKNYGAKRLNQRIQRILEIVERS